MSRLARLAPLLLALAGLVLATASSLGAGGAWFGGGGDGEAARDALARGNRLARRGELEAAVDAYAAGLGDGGGGVESAGDAALAYNLGTTYHRLGRLPEALLWYRRAAAAGSDPWLRENLDLARAELSAARFPPAGVLGRLAPHPAATGAAAALFAWAAMFLYLARRRLQRRLPEALADGAWAAAALLALAAWTAGAALSAWGPRPAVLLDACGGELTEGSEVWVVPAGDDGWAVSGASSGRICPAASVGLVEQR
jgi:tetratricopeptide (TPR) repeat protein